MVRHPRYPLYDDDQQRLEARRKQIRESVRRHRQRKREEAGIVASATLEDSAAAGPSTAQRDVGPIEEIIREPQETDQVLYHTPLHRITVAWNARNHKVEVSWRLPQDLPMNNSHLTVASLLTDYARLTSVRDGWWDYMGPNDCSPTTKKLIIRASVCSCATALGTMTQNPALIQMGDASYHDTITILRRLIGSASMTKYAVALILMARHLSVHDLGFVLQQVAAPQNSWMEHIIAINAIIQQTGPASFMSGLGAEVMQGQLSAMLMIAFKDRKASVVTSSSAWMECLNSIAVHTKLYKDRVWALAFKIPALMQAFDALGGDVRQCTRTESARQLNALYEHILELDQNLDGWVHPFLTSEDGILDRSARLHPGRLETTPSPMYFPTQGAAQCKTMYWGLRLALSDLRIDTERLLDQLGQRASIRPETNFSLPPGLSDAYYYAQQLARTFQWWDSSSTADMSTAYSFCTFPQRIAWRWVTSQKNALGLDQLEMAFVSHSAGLRSGSITGAISEGIVDLLYWTPTEFVKVATSAAEVPA